MKISFYGSTDVISIGVLKALHQKSLEGKLGLAYVISQPPRPVGRKRELKHNPVAQYALDNNIPIFMPEKLSELFDPELGPEKVIHTQVDLAVVASYGKIISERILNIPRYGFINFHVSLLPQYRGAGPVPMSILNQDKVSGLTIIKMDKGMDTGDIIKKEELKIKDNSTAGELMKDIVEMTVEILDKDFNYIFNPENWRPEKQDHDKATYCYEKDLTKESFEVLYSDSIKKSHGKIMAANPEPIAFAKLKVNNLQYKINLIRSKLEDSEIPNLVQTNEFRLTTDEYKKRLFVELESGFLEILELQPEGKKVMDAKSFINGYMRS